MPHNEEWKPVTVKSKRPKKTIKPKKPSKMVDDDIQQAVSSFVAIKNTDGRQLFLDHAQQLMDAKSIENELNEENDKETKHFDSLSGQIKDKTSHLFVTGDIRNGDVVKNIRDSIGSVDLVFTSPPYNADIKYDEWKDNLPFSEYKTFLQDSIDSCDELLNEGGRFVINIRDIAMGTGERYPIIVLLHKLLCKKRNYKYRGVHIWYKGREESSFAWGSYRSSKNPAIIDLFEYVFVFQKDGKRKQGQDDIQKTDFIESVIGVWKIRPVKKIFGTGKKNVAQHPCPFPPELARRVIKLYSQCGDTVLDPFGGVGSTAAGAIKAGRSSVSVDISAEYCDVAHKRIEKEFYNSPMQLSVIRTK